MQNDQNETTENVLGADDPFTSVNEPPVQNEQNEVPLISNPSKQSQKFSMPSLTNQTSEIGTLARLSEKQRNYEQSVPESEIRTLLMKEQIETAKLSSERIDEIGLALIQNYASIELAAEHLKTTPERLRWWISRHEELQQYFEIAHEGIKGITDKWVIARLMEGDMKVVKMVFNKLYAGRAKGAYNASEIGTRGYKDPLSKQIAAETEKDRSKGNIEVVFNFVQKEAKTIDVPILEEHIIDAEEVEDDDSDDFE